MTNMASKPQPLTTAENTIWNLTGCLFYLGCQWLTTVIVVVLSSDYSNSGALAFAMSIGNMFASLALYKIRTYQVSDISNEHTSGGYVAFRFATIIISCIFLTLYLIIIAPGSSMVVSTLAFLLFKADETFVDVLYGVDQKYGRMDYIGKSQILRGFATLVGFTVPLVATDSVVFAIMGMALLCFVNTIAFDVRHARRLDSIMPQFAKTDLQKLAKACLLPTIANFCATSIVSVVRQSYGIYAGDQLLGIYASIATPAVLIQAGATFLYSPLIGKMATALYAKGMREFKCVFLNVLATIAAIMVAGTIALSLVADRSLVLIFGKGLAPYTWIFPYVLGGTTSIAILLYINDALIILRDNRSQIVINAIALALAAALSKPCIAAFGMNGVNIAILAAVIPAVLMGFTKIMLSCKNIPTNSRDSSGSAVSSERTAKH